MTIVQINTVCGFGSTGHISEEIATISNSLGYKNYVAYGIGTSKYEFSYKIGTRLESLFHNVFFTRLLGLHGFGSYYATKRFLKWIDGIKPDIIHIHNLHSNYINYRLLYNYIENNNIPIVFTLHDCFHFTGKCSYYTCANCFKWKTLCNHCPLYRSTAAPSFLFDNSSFLFSDKKKIYSRLNNVWVIAVSKWLMSEAKQSILNTNKHVIDYIYNWIDCEKFKPANAIEIDKFYKKYKLNKSTKYLLTVSQIWDRRTSRYQDAVKLAGMLPEDYRLLLVGKLALGTTISNDKIVYIPYIDSSESMAVAYSIAYAYIHLSIQDTFGLVIAEAMACGCTPIVFNSTACAETPAQFGHIVPPHNVQAIVEVLPSINKDIKIVEDMIAYVKTNYGKETNIKRYIELYKSITMQQLNSK